MFPTHPDTVGIVNTLDYQERLREAAKARIAAGAHTGGHAPRTGLRAARLAAISALGGIVTRVHGAKQAPVSRPLSHI